MEIVGFFDMHLHSKLGSALGLSKADTASLSWPMPRHQTQCTPASLTANENDSCVTVDKNTRPNILQTMGDMEAEE